MKFSIPLFGTNKATLQLSWLEYIWFSCIVQGWYNCWFSFKMWADLMGGNYQNYGLGEDDDLKSCILSFWCSLEDDIYPKFFLESLMQIAHDVETGKVNTIPFTESMMELISDCLDEPNE